MECNCGNDMWDGDGHIVYHVFSKKNLNEYIKGDKKNYIFEQLCDDYPHKQVNFMITEKGSNGGSISYANPNLKPKIYTTKTMENIIMIKNKKEC